MASVSVAVGSIRRRSMAIHSVSAMFCLCASSSSLTSSGAARNSVVRPAHTSATVLTSAPSRSALVSCGSREATSLSSGCSHQPGRRVPASFDQAGRDELLHHFGRGPRGTSAPVTTAINRATAAASQ